MRPGRKIPSSRAWVNPLCEDLAGDTTASSVILAAGGGSPGRRQLSSGGADVEREGAPDQAAIGSPGFLDSRSLLAAQPSAHLLSSYSQACQSLPVNFSIHLLICELSHPPRSEAINTSRTHVYNSFTWGLTPICVWD